jgi:hypothetical protein
MATAVIYPVPQKLNARVVLSWGKISLRIGGTDVDDVSGRDRDLYRAGDGVALLA